MNSCCKKTRYSNMPLWTQLKNTSLSHLRTVTAPYPNSMLSKKKMLRNVFVKVIPGRTTTLTLARCFVRGEMHFRREKNGPLTLSRLAGAFKSAVYAPPDLTRDTFYLNKWASGEAKQNLLSLSSPEWDIEVLPGKEILTPGDFYGQDHLGRWRAACFQLCKGRGFIACTDAL